jgi:hypothetical protein
MPTGELQAGKWTRVVSSWGWYKVRYGIHTGAPNGKYRCYPIYSSGDLPAEVTLNVYPYGDIWVYSPTETFWEANAIFP